MFQFGRGCIHAGGWTNERVELLKELWADGLSANQIASRLGGVSRNAVIGKVHRLGIAGRTATIRNPRPRHTLPSRPKLRVPMISPRCLVKAAVSVFDDPPELGPAPNGRVTLLDLKKNMCRWPIGDPMEKGFHFCGRRKSPGGPYCEHHAAIAYRREVRR